MVRCAPHPMKSSVEPRRSGRRPGWHARLPLACMTPCVLCAHMVCPANSVMSRRVGSAHASQDAVVPMAWDGAPPSQVALSGSGYLGAIQCWHGLGVAFPWPADAAASPAMLLQCHTGWRWPWPPLTACALLAGMQLPRCPHMLLLVQGVLAAMLFRHTCQTQRNSSTPHPSFMLFWHEPHGNAT